MNRSSRVAVAAGAVAFALSFVPAQAQYANQFAPAKRITAGTTSHQIAGTGVVVVQVQVNADGSHKVTKIIRSTNSGNNAAATEMAQTATYSPAHRGSKPIASFYDYTLKFTGKAVAATTDTGATGPIRALIRSGNYTAAKAKAGAYVLSNPGDPQGRILLGLADYYAGDNPGSAAAFNGVQNIAKNYAPVAAQAFAGAAVSTAGSNATLAYTYAQRAYALDHSANSQFAEGVALLALKRPADAVAPLKAARDVAFAQKTTDTKSRVNLDSALFQAYQQSGDTANADLIAADIKRLDPTSTLPGQVLGGALLQKARDARTAKDYPGAVAFYDQAAASGNQDIAVTAYAEAALALQSEATPDYTKVKAYADKALAIKPDDALANYAEAVAYTGTFFKVSHKDSDKQLANSYAQKAITYARAAGNEALALSIESFVKTNLK
jgi:hypothetical protein